MNLYAESSAILAWMLGETSAGAVYDSLTGAQFVLTSELTLVECERAILRGALAGRFSESLAADLRGELEVTAARWNILRLDDEILGRARRQFPAEPVRTLDALHLASALAARTAAPGLVLLSLDGRVRSSARGLGFELLPA